MTTAAGQYSATPLAPLVDETRLGSAGGQALIGITGIILAVVLVLGQISLATSKGISVHLHASVQNVTKANGVMEQIVERSAPAVELEKVLKGQAATLTNTRDAMARTNAELDAMTKTKTSLLDVVGSMRTSSAGLATDVEGINTNTQKMTGLLGELPDATKRTHKQLSRISTDTDAINGELGAIAGKMQKYGLPHAKGAPKG